MNNISSIPNFISLPIFLQIIVLLLSITKDLASFAPSQNPGNESDFLALRDFKSSITHDPNRILESWNKSNHFCEWFGVTFTARNQRVMVLNLENQGLVGSIPPSIGNLTQLEGINLQKNSFKGQIPQEIGRILHLRHLNLTQNSFGGKIPSNLSQCTELRTVEITYNQLVGPIPNELSSLKNLVYFRFGVNRLTGKIPPWLGNFSFLYGLSLTQNNLEGYIPEDLGRLQNLGRLLIWGNNLCGKVPPSIYNLSSLYYLTFAQNWLEGYLPPNLGITLPNLVVFACGLNKFVGEVPVSLSNASRFQMLDFAQNRLTGTLPVNLGHLRDLSRLNFDQNALGTGNLTDLDFLRGLVNCTSLRVLGFARNFFGGEFPNFVANFSTLLETFTAGRNLLRGKIPIGIGSLVNLTLLGFEGNKMSGQIPEEIGKLKKLHGLYLNGNEFSGPIPSSLSNLTSLRRLFLEKNQLEGKIPTSLGGCQKLMIPNLSSNNLNGNIPKEVMKITSLTISLTLSNNSLTGQLPSEVGELVDLLELDLSGNKLTGEIPISLGKCISLESLYLQRNGFEGNISQPLKSLIGLKEIDLSRNNFSGRIPEFLGKFSSLKRLDLSHNDFEGELSKEGNFSNSSGISVLGNKRLCGGLTELHLPNCPNGKEKSSRRLIIIISVVCGAAFTIILVILFFSCNFLRQSKDKTSKSSSTSEDRHFFQNVSYSDLAKATGEFCRENLIGSGSFGSVYKGLLGEEGTPVAVKVLKLEQQGASKSFIDECLALRSVRHRNLLKIITACSSLDRQGNEFKSLVFEFVENGNLDQWLHHSVNEESLEFRRLSFIQRLNIAVGVASALDYLHNDCEIPIVHCDLKPSNVLIDRDMVPRVGDFGLASFLFDTSHKLPESQTFSVGLKGSIGYIPPEYGIGGKVSTFGDIYSYGILLLEMFIGKRPTNDVFKDGLTIHKLALMTLSDSDHFMDLVDPSLSLVDEGYENNYESNESEIEEKSIISNNEDKNRQKLNGKKRVIFEECLASVIRIGVSCSNELPNERMIIRVVVKKLLVIRESYLKSKDK